MNGAVKSGDGYCCECDCEVNLLKAHKSAFHEEKKEKRCTICGKLYFKSSRLVKHIFKHSDNQLKCYVCAKDKFVEFEQLFDHLEEHLDLHIYFCHLCSKSFASRDNFEDHLAVHNSPWRRLLLDCFMCEFRVEAKWGSISKMEEHWIHNHGKRFKCSECLKKFNKFSLFYNHCMRHRKQLPFKCDECSLCFRNFGRLKEHKTNHQNKFNFSCDACDKKFKHKSSFDAHLRFHYKHLRFTCNYCCKLFIRKVSLIDHFFEKSCCVCDEQFHCRTTFDSHFKQKHSFDAMFSCDQCSKSYVLENALKRHKTLKHPVRGENIFCCVLCPYQTITRHNLNRHKRRKHSEKSICITAKSFLKNQDNALEQSKFFN